MNDRPTASKPYFPEARDLTVAPYRPIYGPITPTPHRTLADVVCTILEEAA